MSSNLPDNVSLEDIEKLFGGEEPEEEKTSLVEILEVFELNPNYDKSYLYVVAKDIIRDLEALVSSRNLKDLIAEWEE